MSVATLEQEEVDTLTPGQIIAKYQRQAPVDVVAIARDLGLKVWRMSSLPTGISGKIFVTV